MKYLVSAILALTLTGCAGFDTNPLVEVANNVLDEPTIKSGMTSRDAAYMAAYKRYVDKATADKPIVEIEGTGGDITISGIKSIKVYGQNSSDKITPPEKDKPLVTQIIDSVIRLAERVALPIYIVKETNQTARDSSSKELEAVRIQSGERERVTTQAIESAAKPPLVVQPTFVPSPAVAE